MVFFATKCFAGPMSTEDLKDFDKNVRIRLAVLVAKKLGNPHPANYVS